MEWFLSTLEEWAESIVLFLSHPAATLIIVIILASLGAMSAILIYRKIKDRNRDSGPQQRFRKRDKVMFYGRKIIRKVRYLSHQAAQARRIKKRQMVVRLAKRLLRLKSEKPLTLQVMEPSQAFLEESMSESMDSRLPLEVMYMLRSIRVFGFFEKVLFLELCKHIEISQLSEGDLLFSIGEPDDSIYVIQNGKVVVYVTENDGSTLVLREVGVGENITSLLSVMDVLTGHTAPYKTVSARATEKSSILRLKVEIFRQVLEKDPESLVRVAQIIMVRLQRVTFTALHNYLGLTNQLIKVSSSQTKRVSVISPKTSPSKVGTRRNSQAQSARPSVCETNMTDSLEINLRSELQNSLGDQNASIKNMLNEKGSLIKDAIPSIAQEQEVRNEPDGQEAPKARKRKTSFFVPSENIVPKEMIKEDWQALAVKGFAQHLDLDDISILKEFVIVKEVLGNTHIIREETVEDVALLYVIYGSLSVSQRTVDRMEDVEESVLFVVHCGEIMGALAVLSGEPSLFTVRTRSPSCVGMLSKKHIYEVLRMKPAAVLHLAQSVIERLSPFVRQIDFALDWINVESGRAIYRQGEVSDSTYILLSGRLRSVLNRTDGKKELVGEYGRGDLVGIVEVLTSVPRSTTAMAVRNSELAKLPEGLLNAIKIKYPEVVTRLIHLLGHRLLGSIQRNLSTGHKVDSPQTFSSFATVAIMPVTNNVPLLSFTLELYHSLTAIGPTSRLTSDVIKKILGPAAFTSANEYRLCSWLAQQEDQHKIVLYQCDPLFTSWTQRCVRQADCIILVALVDEEPIVGEQEQEMEKIAVRTQKELILLHRDDGIKPRNTVQWLNMRSWCSSHHHIRCPKRMFNKRSQGRTTEMYNQMFKNPPNINSDFSRLARFLTGTSFGLVLGGGGARGAAHVGVIKALTEAGIPIDMIGGVSIGAFMGALWCQENNLTTFTQKAREWSFKMNSYWRQILDLTYPATAMFTGAAFNRTIHDVFGERQIEDLWLPYFTVTTDITDSTMRVHTYGSLWRYIRSSMSLSGYMPPLCDPKDGHLLLDGGYVNNLPADIMRDRGAKVIIAIDVGSQDDIDLTNYGDTLNGWWLLWKKWNPFSTPVKVPSLQEIQSRLAYVSCVKQLDQIKTCDYCTYVRPPIDKYKTLQFGSFDEILEVGYNHSKELFPTSKDGQKTALNFLSQQNKYHHAPMGRLKDASFTDLAEIVCKIKRPQRITIDNISDDEDMVLAHRGGYVSDPEILADTDKEEDGEEDFSPDRHRESIASFSDVEYCADREL